MAKIAVMQVEHRLPSKAVLTAGIGPKHRQRQYHGRNVSVGENHRALRRGNQNRGNQDKVDENKVTEAAGNKVLLRRKVCRENIKNRENGEIKGDDGNKIALSARRVPLRNPEQGDSRYSAERQYTRP